MGKIKEVKPMKKKLMSAATGTLALALCTLIYAGETFYKTNKLKPD